MERDLVSLTAQPRRQVGSRGTLLVVEDDDALGKLLRAVFEAEGYKVLTARDGVEGLEILQAHSGAFNLVISDLAMPRMNGLQLKEKILSAYPCLKFLLITGYLEEVPGRIAMTDDTVLEKPFHPAELKRKVRELLNNDNKSTPGLPVKDVPAMSWKAQPANPDGNESA